MEPIKRTIKFEGLNKSVQINLADGFNPYNFSKKITVFDSFEIMSIQLRGIDPTDVVLEVKMMKNGPVLKPQRIYLVYHAQNFIVREGYLELFPSNPEVFKFKRIDESEYCELLLSTNNPEIKDPSIRAAINILLFPTPD